MTFTFMVQVLFKPIICVMGYENRTKDKEHCNRLQGTFPPPHPLNAQALQWSAGPPVHDLLWDGERFCQLDRVLQLA